MSGGPTSGLSEAGFFFISDLRRNDPNKGIRYAVNMICIMCERGLIPAPSERRSADISLGLLFTPVGGEGNVKEDWKWQMQLWLLPPPGPPAPQPLTVTLLGDSTDPPGVPETRQASFALVGDRVYSSRRRFQHNPQRSHQRREGRRRRRTDVIDLLLRCVLASEIVMQNSEWR